MLKYIKYYIPALTGISAIICFSMGQNYPTYFCVFWSLFVIIGDHLFPRDMEVQDFSYPSILNISIYINLPIIVFLIFLVVSIFGSDSSNFYIEELYSIFNIDFIDIKDSFTLIDKFALILQTSLFIGILATVPGHELTHRKHNRFDMFVGNWLLAFSWDCTFAIEHVYGHHKDVCLDEDPASAKRGENIYLFILRATFEEQMSGWKIETDRLKRRRHNFFSLQNRMIVGYLRSAVITLSVFIFGGLFGLFSFLLCALLAKSFLEAINYIEHYGLVREKGKEVNMRHAWNSNHFLSSIYLCNVTRHSDHHKSSNLNFWELNPYHEDAPMLPYGYLSTLYLVLFTPFIYKKIMAKELINWDENFANEYERNYVSKLL
tara:strand:- start:646 stop:1773 length:1128 start_codon:yes stop_codon:yes gene_type:complete